MVKKVALLTVMVILLTVSVTALNIDNVKEYDPDLEQITIVNAFGLGDDLLTITLTENTNECLTKCYAEGFIQVHSPQIIFEDFGFYNELNEERTINYDLKYAYLNQWETIEGKYEEVCNDVTLNNGTEVEECDSVQNGTEVVEHSEWVWSVYNGEVLEPNLYKWRLEGDKPYYASIDWIATTSGIELDEWAWWNSNWLRKREIKLEERNGTSTDEYSVFLTIPTSNITNYTNEGVEALRFLNSGETVELDHWVEYNDSNNIFVWVETNLTASVNNSIYMYYANPSASSTSDIQTTFVIGDEFNGASLNATKWSTDGSPVYAVANGYINHNRTSAQGQSIYSNLNLTVTDGYRMVWHGNRTPTTQPLNFYSGFIKGVSTSKDNGENLYEYQTVSADASNMSSRMAYNDNKLDYTLEVWNLVAQQNYRWDLKYDGKTANRSYHYANLTEFGTHQVAPTLNNTNNWKVVVEAQRNVADKFGATNYIAVGKYTYPEPLQSIQSEEVYTLSNISIRAVSNFNNASILIFNATSSESGAYQSNATTGVLTTADIENATLRNYTIIAQGFSNGQYNNQNESFNTSLTPLGYSGIAHGYNDTNKWFGYNATFSCNYTDDMGYTDTITYFVKNENDSVLTTLASDVYQYNNTDFGDTLSSWCQINNSYFAVNSSNTTITGVDSQISFRALDTSNNLLANVNWTGNLTTTSNPEVHLLSEYLSPTVSSINLTGTAYDLGIYYRPTNYTFNVTEDQVQYNLSMLANQLSLTFYQNGVLHATNWTLFNPNGSYFTNTSNTHLIARDILGDGQVNVVFNYNSIEQNWSQYFEYNNTADLHVSEDLEVLDREDGAIVFHITDQNNRDLEFVKIRISMTKAELNNWTDYELIGQRLTRHDGRASFVFDTYRSYVVSITKDDYIPYVAEMKLDDFTSPIEIVLLESPYNDSSNLWVNLPTHYTNASANIFGAVVDTVADDIKYNTQYRIDQGLGNLTAGVDNLDVYTFELIAGTDFNSSNFDNRTVFVYSDDVLGATRQIAFLNQTSYFDNMNIDQDIIKVVGPVALVIASGTVAAISGNMATGFAVFGLGSLVLALINPLFLILTIISSLYFVLKTARKVFSE